jgi:hypothetical protein
MRKIQLVYHPDSADMYDRSTFLRMFTPPDNCLVKDFNWNAKVLRSSRPLKVTLFLISYPP